MFPSLSTQIRRPYSASTSSLPAQRELAGLEVHPELIAFFTCSRNHVTFFCASDWRALQAVRATWVLYTFVQTPSSLFAKGAGHETIPCNEQNLEIIERMWVGNKESYCCGHNRGSTSNGNLYRGYFRNLRIVLWTKVSIIYLPLITGLPFRLPALSNDMIKVMMKRSFCTTLITTDCY